MKYTQLGSSDLKVSRICMGCMGFGNAATGQHSWTLDEAASREIIKRGLELGVNFFDTAIGYQNGTSEEYLGRATGLLDAVVTGICSIQGSPCVIGVMDSRFMMMPRRTRIMPRKRPSSRQPTASLYPMTIAMMQG